jgi:hypothetical protein
MSLEYAQAHWKQVGWPDPNSTDPAAVQFWTPLRQKALGLAQVSRGQR